MNSAESNRDPVTEEQASLWAARLDGSVLTAGDRIALDAWLAGDPARRALLSHYCQFSADLEQQMPLLEGIRDLSAETQTTLKTAHSLPWLRWPLMAGVTLSAAVAVALVTWRAQTPTQSASLATPAAQRQILALADGSQVELNAQTSLQVEINGRERHVRLATGEAFFSVHKDASRPFIVDTPAGSVRVTGTHFDVRAETTASLQVTVAEGSVQVRPTDSSGAAAAPVNLVPGDELSAEAGRVTVRNLSTSAMENALAWRHGQIVFEATPLREALARFARYHGQGITANADVAGYRVGGRFSLDDLNGFLAALEEVLPVRVTRNLSGTVQVEARGQH